MENNEKREMLLKLAHIQSEIEDAIFYMENKQDKENSLKKSWSAVDSIDKITEQLKSEIDAFNAGSKELSENNGFKKDLPICANQFVAGNLEFLSRLIKHDSGFDRDNAVALLEEASKRLAYIPNKSLVESATEVLEEIDKITAEAREKTLAVIKKAREE